MKKAQTNYAFIDGQNLYLSVKELAWTLDNKKFRIYLSEKYGIHTAYYFIGYVSENAALYDVLESYGYVMTYRPTFSPKEGKVKGNCDAELVLQAMIDFDKYDKAVIVTSDGDFACLVSHLRERNKLQCVLASSKKGCSHLLEKAAQGRISYMDELKGKLEYKKGEPCKDETLQHSPSS